MDFLNLVKINSGLNGFQPLLPIAIFLSFILILFLGIDLSTKLNIFFLSFLVANIVIFFDLIKYVKSIKDLIFTIITINLANLFFALGGILTFLGLKNVLINKIYLLSRKRNNSEILES